MLGFFDSSPPLEDCCGNDVSRVERLDNVALALMVESEHSTERPVGDEDAAAPADADLAAAPVDEETNDEPFIKLISTSFFSNAPTSITKHVSILHNSLHAIGVFSLGMHQVFMVSGKSVINGHSLPSDIPIAVDPISVPPLLRIADPDAIDMAPVDESRGYIPNKCFPSMEDRSERLSRTCSWTKEKRLDKKLSAAKNFVVLVEEEDELEDKDAFNASLVSSAIAMQELFASPLCSVLL